MNTANKGGVAAAMLAAARAHCGGTILVAWDHCQLVSVLQEAGCDLPLCRRCFPDVWYVQTCTHAHPPAWPHARRHTARPPARPHATPYIHRFDTFYKLSVRFPAHTHPGPETAKQLSWASAECKSFISLCTTVLGA